MTGNRALILDFGGIVTRTLFETHDITERALGLGTRHAQLARPL
jgi:putative hydrolase of the HAD superfamily